MSRTLRPNLPGGAFHITARTHRKEPWFKDGGLCGRISSIIEEGVTSSDARLLALTVMPNHFHIVLRQARRPLGWIMHPIMRRIALLCQRRFNFEGHAFERRYRARHCNSAAYLRRAIIYTNINARRAGLCDVQGRYPWTSHTRYVMDENAVTVAAIEVAFVLPLFADAPGLSMGELRAEYSRQVAWRLAKDEHDAAELPYNVPEPEAGYGDAYFVENFLGAPVEQTPPLADLRDRALFMLARIEPQIEIDEVRRCYGTRHITMVRNELIAGLIQAGYRRKSIANYLRVSDATVSTIASKMRFAFLNPEKRSG